MKDVAARAPCHLALLGRFLALRPACLAFDAYSHDLVAADCAVLDVITAPVPHRDRIPRLDVDGRCLVLGGPACLFLVS